MLLYLGIGLVLGLLVSPMVLMSLVPSLPARFGKWLVEQGIKTNDRWVFEEQEDRTLELKTLEKKDEWDAYAAEGDDEQIKEDKAGLMMRMHNRPVALSYEKATALVDNVTAAVGQAEAQKATDGGVEIVEEDDDTLKPANSKVGDLQEMTQVGRIEQKQQQGDLQIHRIIDFVNPFVTIPENGVVTNVRDTVSMLKHNGSTDTPKKAAEDARLAEAAGKDRSQLVQNASLMGAFFLGALVVYIFGGAGGGGAGGGGGIDIGLMLAQPWFGGLF